jgi:hypothetical protein
MINISIKQIQEGILKLELSPISFLRESSTYYWAIDDFFEKGDEGVNKVLKNLKLMLSKWLDIILQNEKKGMFYLPFDFSDEYIGMLKISFSNYNIAKVEYGCTKALTGWEISPSQYKDFNIQPNGYKPISSSFEISTKDFIEDLNTWIKNIDNFSR